jgi:hypothetical protein
MLARGVSVALTGLEEVHLDGRTLKTIGEHTQLTGTKVQTLTHYYKY